MAFIGYESDCVSCERCFNCGRKEKYPVWECDRCGSEIYREEDICEEGTEQLCKECFEELEEEYEESEEE